MNRKFIENKIQVVLTHIKRYSISFIMQKCKLKTEIQFFTYWVGKYTKKKRSITLVLLMGEELNCTVSVEDN